jgi:hypothetical protein
MYSTCLFCNHSLGANTAIEQFPVGQRLAFDPAKGRLWVICRRCERWNLSPLEERWEAIEECERRFSDTRLRTSTENIGLGRLKEGLELVRIGVPQRPEFAAWRYGDQFGRRRRNRIIRVGAATTALGGVAVGLVTAGIATGASFGGAWWMMSRGFEAAYRRVVHGSPGEIVAQVPLPGGERLPVRRRDLGKIGIIAAPGGGRGPGAWKLAIPADSVLGRRDWVGAPRLVTGEDAIRAAGSLLPALNWGGANATEVARATDLVERTAGSAREIFDLAASQKGSESLLKLETPIRLALEMAAHEESERRALEGELALLETAWKEAEEIAGIADDLFLPPEIEERIRKGRTT